MDDASWQKVKRIYQRACVLPAGEVDHFLSEACGGDDRLQTELNRLMTARPPAEFLEPARCDEEPKSVEGHEDDDIVGAQLGAFRVIRLFATGASARVYLAERNDGRFGQRGAVKILKRGMDTSDLLRRFRMERETLAKLRHPGIAHIVDAGSTAMGRPYIVMEFVDGEPITQFCDRHGYSTRQRLGLFLRVCDSVQYAHQHGVIHRDLKPANILVVGTGDDAMPKVVDFGVAKLLPHATENAAQTTHLSGPIGTPQYMSPEQLAPTDGVIDTRTDVYAASAILYELLTGVPPYQIQYSGYLGAIEMRSLHSAGPPSPLSNAIKSSAAQRRKQCDMSRASDVGAPPRRIAHELDWIVLKGLHHDPDRRYSSIESLADDINRYLTGRPVSAHPSSRLYLLRKSFVRHRPLYIVAIVAVFAVTFGVAALTFGMVLARQEADRAVRFESEARREAARATEVSAFLKGLLKMNNPFLANAAGPGTTVRELLDQAAHTLDVDPPDDPRLRVDMNATIGSAYRALGLYDCAESHLRRALAGYRSLPECHDVEVAEVLMELGLVARSTTEMAEGERLMREAIRLREQTFGAQSVAVAEAQTELANLLCTTGKLEEARRVFTDAIGTLQRHPEANAALVNALTGRARLSHIAGRYDEAEAYARKALAAETDPSDPDGVRSAEVMRHLAAALFAKGEYRVAESELRRALTIWQTSFTGDHVAIGYLRNDLGLALKYQGRLGEAIEQYRLALSLHERFLGATDPKTVVVLNNLAAALVGLERYEEALPLYRQAYEVIREKYGTDHFMAGEVAHNRGRVLLQMGRLDEAERYIEEGRLIRLRTRGPRHAYLGYSHDALSELRFKQGDYVGAEREARRALAIFERAVGSEHRSTAFARIRLATALVELDKRVEAKELLVQACDALEQSQIHITPRERERIRQLSRRLDDEVVAACCAGLFDRSGPKQTGVP